MYTYNLASKPSPLDIIESNLSSFYHLSKMDENLEWSNFPVTSLSICLGEFCHSKILTHR